LLSSSKRQLIDTGFEHIAVFLSSTKHQFVGVAFHISVFFAAIILTTTLADAIAYEINVSLLIFAGAGLLYTVPFFSHRLNVTVLLFLSVIF
jgi:hypothetical protein